MKNILYCEDDRLVRDSVVAFIKAHFSNINFLVATDIASVFDKNVRIDQLDVVMTDGILGYPDYGWDIAEKLRERGYNGPIVYVGGADIPADKIGYFSDVVGKSNTDKLLETLRKYL